MTARAKWIVAIVGLLAGNVLAMTALAVTASHGHSQVIPAYYERAVHYDDAIDEAARSRALGWHATATLAGGELVVTARDSTGVTLAGARVHVAGYQRAHAGDGFDVELAADGDRYRAPVPARAGACDIQITIERGGARFVERAAIEAR